MLGIKQSIAVIMILLAAFVIMGGVSSFNNHKAIAESSSFPSTFGCLKIGAKISCDPSTSKFNSVAATGRVQRILTLNSSHIDLQEGVFGKALAVSGYRQQYLTIPNQLQLNPPIISVSFWIKQDPAYRSNSTVISHVNSDRKAGWYVEYYTKGSQSHNIRFSVPNSAGRIFSASSPIEPGIFQNVVGVFDGKFVRIYLNGYLVDSIVFEGKYEPDPKVPLNIGLNSYNYGGPWNGEIDEVRLYNRAISDNEIQGLVDYAKYLEQSGSSSKNGDDGLVAYWPFDSSLQDKLTRTNNGRFIMPAVSMIFSPDGRLFYSVRDAGEIRIIKQDLSPLEGPFVRLRDPSDNTTQQVLGITLDPEFATNHFVYAYVTARDNNTGDDINRVIRFTEVENHATQQQIIIDNIPAAATGHLFAGALAFGPDGKLYVGAGYNKQIEPGQNANLTGKVLRLNRDGTIPTDNPFLNSPIYTSGHGDIFGIAFDNVTGMALVAENDPSHNDEINLLKKGSDYGYHSVQKKQTLPEGSSSLQIDNSAAIPPVRSYYKVITPTQMIFYDGNRFPELRGMFLVPSYKEGTIYALSLNETGNITNEIAISLPEIRGHIVAIANTTPNGEIYIAGENIYKIVTIDKNRPTFTYFIDTRWNNNYTQTKAVSLNLTTKILSIDFRNNIATQNGNVSTNATSPSLRVVVPKSLLGAIHEVTSEKYNKTFNPADKIIDRFDTKETLKTTNAGNTIIDIQLKNDVTTDKILIKGQTSTLVPPPRRSNVIYR